jgi:hypothetical protein
MNYRLFKLVWLTVAVILVSSCGSRAFSDQDNSLWTASADAPLTFTVTQVQASEVMTKAQVIMTDPSYVDTGIKWMRIQTITPTLIQTYKPISGGMVGFIITCTPDSDNYQICVQGQLYDGLFIAGKDDKQKAMKRVHLLAYLMAQSANMPGNNVLPTPVAPAVLTPAPIILSKGSALPEDLELYMTLIRSQLLAGKYDTAIATIDAFKSAVTDKEKAGPGQ